MKNTITNTVMIMNSQWSIIELKEASKSTWMQRLISEYMVDQNCRPYDWIIGEKLTDFEKATFIYSCNKLNKMGA
jgi:folate-binding Fe-S cluster repair protein YgfZ